VTRTGIPTSFAERLAEVLAGRQQVRRLLRRGENEVQRPLGRHECRSADQKEHHDDQTWPRQLVHGRALEVAQEQLARALRL
jgi:hypothetical protein